MGKIYVLVERKCDISLFMEWYARKEGNWHRADLKNATLYMKNGNIVKFLATKEEKCPDDATECIDMRRSSKV